jgi:hypothetical protein
METLVQKDHEVKRSPNVIQAPGQKTSVKKPIILVVEDKKSNTGLPQYVAEQNLAR